MKWMEGGGGPWNDWISPLQSSISRLYLKLLLLGTAAMPKGNTCLDRPALTVWT